jgi:hypothetical protein
VGVEWFGLFWGGVRKEPCSHKDSHLLAVHVGVSFLVGVQIRGGLGGRKDRFCKCFQSSSLLNLFNHNLDMVHFRIESPRSVCYDDDKNDAESIRSHHHQKVETTKHR